MKSFTWGSDEGMQALAVAMRSSDDEKFEAAWNESDFEAIIYALREFSNGDASDQADFTNRCRAASILSSIAEVYGVEFI